MSYIRKEVKYLRVDFTREELEQFGKEMARSSAARDEAVEGKKAATAQFSEKIARAEMEIAAAARKINQGYEFRNVECQVRLDKPQKGMAIVIRLDTGAEVERREITSDEKQRELPLESGSDETNS